MCYRKLFVSYPTTKTPGPHEAHYAYHAVDSPKHPSPPTPQITLTCRLFYLLPSDLILILLVLREVQLKLMADTTRGRARLEHKRLILIALPPFIHRRPRRAVRIVIRADIGA